MSGGEPQSDAGARACQECGEQLAPQAAFCRSCGAKYATPEPGPEQKPETTPVCTKCGATLSSGASFCRACGAPVDGERPSAVKPPVTSPPPAPRATPPPKAPAKAVKRPSRNRIPIAIGIVLFLIGAGVAVALFTQGASSTETITVAEPFAESEPTSEFDEAEETEASNDASVEAEQSAEAEEAQAAEEELEDQERVEAEGAEEEAAEAEGEAITSDGVPAVSRSQMNEEVGALLESYHEDVVDEDFQGAWAMLSPRKRRQYTREYGYRKWASAQASLSPYLHPAGLTAEVVALEGEGVARVEVNGMKWDQPGAPCSEWSGLTWVKYEGDEWTYDPGYSTTAARTAAWKAKSSHLLGGDCSG